MPMQPKSRTTGEIAPLPERLLQASVGGCTCGTKTHEAHHHDPLCHYRLFSEVLAEKYNKHTAQNGAARDEWGDREDQWTSEIHASHPLSTGAHKEYVQAMSMVGNRQSKDVLVDLVCWLLQNQKQP